jgi:hypothetical protein
LKTADAITSSMTSGRLAILDQLRGLCLVVMTIDHIGLFPSLLEIFTGRSQLWVTAAEGFFFISGIMIGLVRGRAAERVGLAAVTRKLWARAGRLYLVSIAFTTICLLLGYALMERHIPGVKYGLVYFDSTRELVVRVVTMLYTYSWVDFLPYYIIYLLISPLAIWLLMRGRWRWVVAASLIAWTAPLLIHLPAPSGLRWQAYFFIGIVCGYHREAIRQRWLRVSNAARKRIGWRLVTVSAVMLTLSALLTLTTANNPGVYNLAMNTLNGVNGNPVYLALFQNDRTGLLRLPIFLIVFGALYFLFSAYQPLIKHRLAWLLEPMGRNSLYVYTVLGALAFVIPLVPLPREYFLNALVEASAIITIWILVKRRVLFSVIPR